MAIRNRPLGNQAVLVLASLASGVRYGFDVMDHTGLKSGTVYRALARLEELGLVRSRWETPSLAVRAKRPRRRYYEITAEGAAELASARDTIQAFAKKLFHAKP